MNCFSLLLAPRASLDHARGASGLALGPTVPAGGSSVRIATLLPFPLSQKGGVTTYVAGLMRGLRMRNIGDIMLIGPDRFRGGPGEHLSQLLLAAQQIGQLLRLQPSIVHVHEHPVLLGAAIVYRVVATRRVRVVYTLHVDPIRTRPLWKRLVLGQFLRHCWAVTAVSQHTAAEIGNISSPAPRKVRVISGATDVRVRSAGDPAVAGFRREYGLDDGPILCEIAPFNSPGKVAGLLELILALRQLRNRFPSAKLVLVGDGQLRPKFEAACASYGLATAVVLTGYLDDVSLPLAAADVYCHLTFHDACPLSLLEAMRSRKPIVATAVGGIPELITHDVDGLLVDGTADSATGALVALLENPERASMLAARAERTALTSFTWERVAAEFDAVYDVASLPPPQR